MNTDIRLNTGYFDHPKIRKLRKILGPEGVLSHITLLTWVGATRPYYRDGILRDFDPEDVAAAARWRGDPEEFTNTLLDLGLLDNGSEGLEIHNWKVHNYYRSTFDARSKIARRSSNISWLIRRGIIARSQQIPPHIDLDQDLDKIIEQIQSFNAERKPKRKANRNANRKADPKAPSPPPPPPPGGGGGEGAVDSSIEEKEEPLPPFTDAEIAELRAKIDQQDMDPEIKADLHSLLDKTIKVREEKYHEQHKTNQ